jgi:hypothetical protein
MFGTCSSAASLDTWVKVVAEKARTHLYLQELEIKEGLPRNRINERVDAMETD